MTEILPFPDVASMLLYALVPLEPDVRFLTALQPGTQR